MTSLPEKWTLRITLFDRALRLGYLLLASAALYFVCLAPTHRRPKIFVNVEHDLNVGTQPHTSFDVDIGSQPYAAFDLNVSK